jgi:transcriptional regulator with GAF, ATPase, and Fis domain
MEHEPFGNSSLHALVAAARELQTAGNTNGLLEHLVDIAVETIEGCAYAGVSTNHGGRLNSPVVSDPHVLEIDAAQYSIGNGPCLEAMRGPEVFIDAPDLEHDERFAAFAPGAAAQGCRAVLAHRLYVDSETVGSLNLYASEPHAYSATDRQRAVVLSVLASLAINAARLELDSEGLREAVQTRDVIGQAKGILMQRDRVTADEAFASLRRESQRQNVKLRELAEQLVAETQTDR